MSEIDKILKKIEDGRQFRRNDLHPEFRAFESETGDMIVEGHATTFDEEYLLGEIRDDFSGYTFKFTEVIDRHAFDNCDMSDVIFLYDHRGRVFARNRNNTLIVEPDEFGLKVRANLATASEGAGLFHDIKAGLVDRMSMQFTVESDQKVETRDDEAKVISQKRIIKSIAKLYDVSAVGIPANDGTDISARNYCDGVIAEFKAERLKEQKLTEARERLKLKIKLEELNHGN